jgi:asparagine synthase (glutamine-hydrolysing)
MCGIIGFSGVGETVCESSQLERGVLALAHRGPDAEGIVGWDAGGRCHRGRTADRRYVVGLGHRRLAILDLSAAGTQPMTCPQGNWLVFNGEIYNYLEIRAELETLGHRFVSGSDTEVILAAYAQWGTDCVQRFNGMWAFALYDVARKGLFWSRDRLGVKPFFYSHGPKAAYFASEVPALYCLLRKPPVINRTELARYLVLGMSDEGEDTFYKDVQELPPGHSAWLDRETGSLNRWQYWSLPQEPDLELTDEEAVDRFSDLLQDSVRLRLRSDVPLAITLSGGTDSSAVALAASRAGATGIVTITSTFPDHPEIDESAYAREVAKTCRFESILVEPDVGRLVEEEPDLTRHQAAPYASLSLYVHWALIKRIKELGIPVVLCGQGGDELFLGYERYYVMHCLSQSPNLFRMSYSAFQASVHSKLGVMRTAAYLAYFGNRHLRRRRLFHRARPVYNAALLDATPELPRYMGTSLRHLQANEIAGEQLRHLLRYDDRTTAAHGMETRLPFLDYRLVEFAYRLPWRFKIRQGWTKYLIRLYIERHGLPNIAWRKRKLGFDAPNADWTRRLVECRGERLMAGPFRRALVRPGLSRFDDVARPSWWDVYHVLNLADILHWEPDWK